MVIIAEEKDENLSLKQVLLNRDFSSTLIKNYKHNGKILVNNQLSMINRIIKKNDIIELILNDANESIEPQKMELKICYEDDDILVIDKPAGVVVHPTTGYRENTLANGIAWYYEDKKIKSSIRPVNRLDKDTSGLIVFAKNPFMQNYLQNVCPMNKLYLAIIEGKLKDKGTIDLPIGRKPGSIVERMVRQDGERAITHYTVLKSSENLSLLRVKIETGRTHQIRVHLSHIGHPIIGDTLYGSNKLLIRRQALHSFRISLKQPFLNKYISICAQVPQDMKNVLINSF